MSRKLSKLTIYTPIDFKNGSKLDRIMMAEMQPEKFMLSDYEQRYLEDLREAYGLVSDELSEGVAVVKIRNLMIGYESYAAAAKLLSDMQEYWRRFISKNKEYKQGMVAAKIYALAKKAEDIAETVEELDLVTKMLERAAKLEGLDKIADLGINPDDIQIGDVIITSDIRALRAEEEAENDNDE